MSTIKISEITPVGTELFQDNESFLWELTEKETSLLQGGLVVSQVTYSIGYEYIPTQANTVDIVGDELVDDSGEEVSLLSLSALSNL